MARVLAPGGWFLFNTWDVIEHNDFEAAVAASLRSIFPADPPTFLVRIPHGYASLEQVTTDLALGGLRVDDATTRRRSP